MKSLLSMLPKEHGAWAVFYVPMIVGTAVAGHWSANLVLLFLSSSGLFLTYQPIQVLFRMTPPSEKHHAARIWTPVFLVWAAVPGLFLLFQGLWLLVPIAILAAALFLVSLFLTRDKPKSIVSDLAAVIGLTLTAPAAMYVLSGSLLSDILLVWLLNVLFFGSSVFYVHMKIKASGLKKEHFSRRERMLIGYVNILYHLAVLGILFTMVQARYAPSLAFVAFVPVSLHALIGTARLSSRVRFKKLGFLLLGQSLLFAILISLTFIGS